MVQHGPLSLPTFLAGKFDTRSGFFKRNNQLNSILSFTALFLRQWNTHHTMICPSTADLGTLILGHVGGYELQIPMASLHGVTCICN